mmetsp:Transcript_31433/g.47936  ORF Transcript_31433/g.47936 Transcript_31433/m.47936 type:complete len:213 (+) Transcript_31433:3-641(+)
MDQLKLGDQILTATGHYEPIYSFGHRSPDTLAEFVQLLPSKLELSPSHMVFLQSGEAVPASIVKIGDVLQSGESVTGIQKLMRTGVYAPFTPSGTLLVNGVTVSSYIAFSESANIFEIGPVKLPYHTIAHSFQFLHRAYCLMDGCKQERYSEEGLSKWVEGGYRFAIWLHKKHSALRMLAGFLLILSGSSFILFQCLTVRVNQVVISVKKHI